MKADTKEKYYICNHCGEPQHTTEFGECAECGYEDLIEISEDEYNHRIGQIKKAITQPTIEDWAKDCEILGVQMKKYAHANKYLGNGMIGSEWNKTVDAIYNFSIKYGTDEKTAGEIGKIVADNVNLKGFIK